MDGAGDTVRKDGSGGNGAAAEISPAGSGQEESAGPGGVFLRPEAFGPGGAGGIGGESEVCDQSMQDVGEDVFGVDAEAQVQIQAEIHMQISFLQDIFVGRGSGPARGRGISA